jgi:hypothetical protein
MTIHWHFEKTSPRAVVTGESDQHAGSRGAVTKYTSGAETVICSPVLSSLPANLALLRAPFYRPAIELLKALDVAQALRDVLLALGVLLLLLIILGSIPLAIGMMLFVYFQ